MNENLVMTCIRTVILQVLTKAETWDPFWWPPLIKAEIGVAVGLTWDLFWWPPLTKTKKSIHVARSTWNPIWRFPLTKADIDVVLPDGRVWTFRFKNFLIGSSHFIVVPESKPWFFAIINLMILSSSTILLDYIKNFSCNDSKTCMQWFMIRWHACILTWFWNIGPIIFFYFMKLSLDMSLLLKSYAGFISRAASFYLSYLWEVFDFLQVAFSKCMTCHCLLCHAFVKCFNLSFSNLRALIPF